MYEDDLYEGRTVRKMDPEKKAIWLTALRSGEYAQGTGHLCKMTLDNVKQYCCLGVLASLNPDVIVHEVDDYGMIRFTTESDGNVHSGAHLPSMGTVEWAGIDDNYAIEHNGIMTTLFQLNDGGYTFEYIADLIEAQL